MDHVRRVMRDHLLREALVEGEGMTPQTVFLVGDGSHIRHPRINPMTAATRERLGVLWPPLVRF